MVQQLRMYGYVVYQHAVEVAEVFCRFESTFHYSDLSSIFRIWSSDSDKHAACICLHVFELYCTKEIAAWHALAGCNRCCRLS